MKYLKPVKPEGMEHSIVYRNNDEFCAWPFNGGMWKISNNNILASFMNDRCDYANWRNLAHKRISAFGKMVAVRSLDEGKTWSKPVTVFESIKEHEDMKFGILHSQTEPLDFTNPEVLLCSWSNPQPSDENSRACIKLSKDGGVTWGSTVVLPSCGFKICQGRPSYIVRPDGVILLMVTVCSEGDRYNRSVVYSSLDGGCSWGLMSLIPTSGEYNMICASPVLLPDGGIIAAIRCMVEVTAAWSEVYYSGDGGRTWRFFSRINDYGDTVHVSLLNDGRLFSVYTYRRPPYGIRARLSEDGGKTWGQELIIRDDGGGIDVGYPRSTEISGNRVLMVYYFNDKDDSIQIKGGKGGGVRYIGSTLLKV